MRIPNGSPQGLWVFSAALFPGKTHLKGAHMKPICVAALLCAMASAACVDRSADLPSDGGPTTDGGIVDGGPGQDPQRPDLAAWATDGGTITQFTMSGSGFGAYVGHKLHFRVFEESFAQTPLNFTDSISLTQDTFSITWDLPLGHGDGYFVVYYYVDLNDDGNCDQAVDANWRTDAQEAVPSLQLQVTPASTGGPQSTCNNL